MLQSFSNVSLKIALFITIGFDVSLFLCLAVKLSPTLLLHASAEKSDVLLT